MLDQQVIDIIVMNAYLISHMRVLTHVIHLLFPQTGNGFVLKLYKKRMQNEMYCLSLEEDVTYVV